jgi:hypothetical protein
MGLAVKQPTTTARTFDAELTPASAHSPLLVLPAIPAHATVDVRGVGAVLQVVTAGCRQGGLERGRPRLVSLRESPDLLGGQAEVSNYCLKRSARIDALEKPLPDFGGKPSLCFSSPPAPLRVSVRLTAGRASTAAFPSRVRAMSVPLPHSRQSIGITAPRPLDRIPRS